MIWLRTIFGIGLIATVGWLVAVLTSQIGYTGALIIAVLVATIILLFYLKRVLRSPVGRVAGKLTVLIALGMMIIGAGSTKLTTESIEKINFIAEWQAFDRNELLRLVKTGKTVLVDVTADWCLTCKVNKVFVLESPTIMGWLANDNVIAMRADWTRPNSKITEYLSEFGRYGIPFNAIYGPQFPRGIVLSELLTSDMVLAAARRANLTK